MPIKQDHPKPKIKIIFQGFVISRVKDGNSFADVGALNTSACHKPKVSIMKRDADGEINAIENLVFDVNKDFEIKVENPFIEKIVAYRKETDANNRPFDRRTGDGDENDFRWFINFDTELFNEDLTVIHSKLQPIFRVNNAIFYTETRTKGKLKIARQGREPELFGRAAEQIAANIYFKHNSKAVLKNGINDVLTIGPEDPNASYLILFNCECHQDIGESDFPLVFDVITPRSGQRLDFRGENVVSGPGNTPEVPCFGVNLSNN